MASPEWDGQGLSVQVETPEHLGWVQYFDSFEILKI